MNTDASLIIPTYNESGTIRQAIMAALDGLGPIDSEIVVVDDDSTDGTASIVRQLDLRDVRVIVRTEASGLSSAVLRGFDAANGDVLAVMDGDLQHPPRRVRSLVERVLGDADMAIGSRHCDAGTVEAEWALYRQVISKGATALAWAAVPQARSTTDPMSGLFAIDADLVDASRERLRPTGYKIGLELLARCPVETVEEVGYTFQERPEGESNLGFSEYINYVKHLARLSVPARRSRGVDSVQEVAVDDV